METQMQLSSEKCEIKTKSKNDVNNVSQSMFIKYHQHNVLREYKHHIELNIANATMKSQFMHNKNATEEKL